MVCDYSKGKIYKIYSLSKPELVYIGSTTQSLNTRLRGHICSKNISSKIIIDNCNDYIIELIEEYPCENKEQLFKKEGEYIKNYKCVNKFISGRSYKEWYSDNKEKIKIHRLDHAEEIKEYQKKYKLKHFEDIKKKKSTKIECDCGAVVRNDGFASHRKSQKHIQLMSQKTISLMSYFCKGLK